MDKVTHYQSKLSLPEIKRYLNPNTQLQSERTSYSLGPKSFLTRLNTTNHFCLYFEVLLFVSPGVLSVMSLLKEMDKYRDIDEDELLKKLSEEELQRLEDELEELDPDVSF